MTNKTIVFNTGRRYSSHGQRIADIQLDNGAIAVVDIDRVLDYLIPADFSPWVKFDQASILSIYDKYSYILDSLSHANSGGVIEQLRAAAEGI
jgi:hypothetical protein